MLKTHVSECYDLKAATQCHLSSDNEINLFFHEESRNVEGKEVAIHIKGLEEKIEPGQLS